jgi:hypothetical protein
MNSTLNNIPLEILRKNMGEHSNKTIDNILTFEKEAKLELTEITDMIKKNVVSFLIQKTAITSEYGVWDANWDIYLFENREKYRQNTRETITYILTKAQKKPIWVDNPTLAELKAELEKELVEKINIPQQ